MKKIVSILLLCLIFPSLALAKDCGVLDFGTDVMWEYRDGAFFDIDGLKMSDAVPNKKKIQITNLAGLVSIEKAGSIKSKGKTTALKFSIKAGAGRVIQTLKSGKKLIGLFERNDESLNFILINAENGSVFRASVSNQSKIIFKLDDVAFYSPDDCSHNEE